MTRYSALLSHLLLSLPLATGLLCAAPAASAQTTILTVNVPFAFTANNHRVAAGSYLVRYRSERFLVLSNQKTSRTEFFMVRPEAGRAIETASRLTFHRNGGQYYLAQIWMSGSSVHSEMVAKPRRNQEVAQVNPPAEQTIELAMK